jgi:hypothetical protein
MDKINIEIIELGNLKGFIDLKKIMRWKSRIFEIRGIRSIGHLPKPRGENIYLDCEYSDSEIAEIIGVSSGCVRIGIINTSFSDNFYVHGIDENTAVISIKIPEEILRNKSIPLENFIIKTIYELLTLFLEFGNAFAVDAYSVPHQDTRGCLFDLNGDLYDIIYNTEKPRICEECISRIKEKNMPDGFLELLTAELKRIRKNSLLRIELFIKAYPFLSLLITVLLTIALNLLSSWLYSKL